MQLRDEEKKVRAQQAKGGCPYIVAYHSYGDGTSDKYAEFCNKFRAPASAYCPKHKLIVDQIPAEYKRRMVRVRAGKEKRAMMREALATSPLAGFNPAFDQKHGKKDETYSK